MMITSTETSSSVTPPAAPPMMGVGTGTSVSGVVVGLSNCTEVDYMTMATTSMFYKYSNIFIVIKLHVKVCTNCVTSLW